MKHAMRMALYDAQGRACSCCDKYMPPPKPNDSHDDPDSATREHVIPKHSGGIIVLLAHRKCNEEKAGRPPTERELKRIETTLKHLAPAALKTLLAACVDKVKRSEEAVAAATRQAGEARTALAIVLRYAPTAEAAASLKRLERAARE